MSSAGPKSRAQNKNVAEISEGLKPLGATAMASYSMHREIRRKGRPNLLQRARRQEIEVSLFVLLNDHDAVVAVLSEAIPDWLRDELACEGVHIYKEKSGAWILAPLDE
jgi:hypothetical protein